MTTLGGPLRERRLELELTLRQIASEMGVEPMYVSQIERGQRIPQQPDRIKTIASAYQLPEGQVAGLAVSARAEKGTIEIDTSNATPDQRDLAVSLARTWMDLNAEQIRRMRDILEEE